jgi:hypothetical protein
MGNVPAAMFDCSCIEGVYKSLGTDSDAKAAQDRVDFLQRGSKFARKALLGLTSQEMFQKLSDDTSAVEWKTIGAEISNRSFCGRLSLAPLLFQIR